MTTRIKWQPIILSIVFFALLSLPFPSLSAQVNPTTGPVQTLGKSIPGLDIIVKKTPGGSQIMRYGVKPDGRFNFGTLPEGTYSISLALNIPSNAKTFYESRSNLRTAMVAGVKGGALGFVWDVRQNQLFELTSLGLKAVQEITFEVTGEEEVGGTISGIAILEPSSKITAPTS